VIEVGQVLRVVPPTAVGGRSAAVSRLVNSLTVTPNNGAGNGKAAPASGAAAAPAPAWPPRPCLPPCRRRPWLHLACQRRLLAGLTSSATRAWIGGKAGDPVLAAADGRVVYAGAGLRGYGNLIILKHNNTYLTAYAHNQSLLVKEDQACARARRLPRWAAPIPISKLHFEVLPGQAWSIRRATCLPDSLTRSAMTPCVILNFPGGFGCARWG
jgi:lipoprotein NlpD